MSVGIAYVGSNQYLPHQKNARPRSGQVSSVYARRVDLRKTAMLLLLLLLLLSAIWAAFPVV